MSESGVGQPAVDPADASDADRARVIDALRAAGPRIGLEEAERRMDRALAVTSRADLALLVWDLPAGPQPAPDRAARSRPSVWRSAAFRAHATAYGLVNAMLVGIWAIADPHDLFWPFFPIAGWGIGMGLHAVSASSTMARRARARDRRRPDRGAAGRPDRPELRARTGRPANVVVMFTDVVDSTRLTMVIGDEDWTRLRARYRALIGEAYRTCRGREVSSSGDGFLARFDRPADAVACAVEIQTRLQKQRDEYGFAPAVRIGINAGQAIEEGGDVLGTVVNLASRVTASAEPNEILVTESVADGLDHRFRLRDGGLREMKGLDRTCHVFSVTWR